jgi:flagellar assembly factor FliW
MLKCTSARSIHPSMVTIPSTRFGALEIGNETAIDFPLGLIGLPGKRYVRVAREADSHFSWLHSLDHPQIAVPVTSPSRWFEHFAIALSDEDVSRIGTSDIPDAAIHVSVRMDSRTGGMAVNLRAPIVILGDVGHQVINHARGASLQAPLPPALRAAA